LKFKATILKAILAEIDRRGLTQQELVDVLDEYQPNVSILLHCRIGQMSIEKLLRYADRLSMRSSIELRPPVKTRTYTTKRIASKTRRVA
jgi:predicted XRE-type DNA-binding protein